MPAGPPLKAALQLDSYACENGGVNPFLIGRFVRECPGLVKETAARGHALGNHTESHRNLFKLSPSQITVELRLCHHAITNTIGAPPKWFRPPYGFRNPWVIPAATA